MFWWAGCTQQEEPKIPTLRGNYTGVDSIYVPKPKFDPNKHYIISVDTVGFKRKLKPANNNYTQSRSGRAWQFGYWDTTTGDNTADLMFWDFGGFEFTTDSTWADKEHLLVTPTEKKKIRDWLGD